MDGTATCTKCGATKALTEFAPDKRKANGRKSACKACYRDLQNRYRAKHLEHVKAIEKKAMTNFRQRRPERLREIGLKHFRANRERYNEYSRQYRRLHPDKKRAETQRYRARKAQAHGTHDAADIARQLDAQHRRCWWCHAPLAENEYHVDHRIPLYRNGSNGPENIVIACPDCNLSKNARMPWEFNGRLL